MRGIINSTHCLFSLCKKCQKQFLFHEVQQEGETCRALGTWGGHGPTCSRPWPPTAPTPERSHKVLPSTPDLDRTLPEWEAIPFSISVFPALLLLCKLNPLSERIQSASLRGGQRPLALIHLRGLLGFDPVESPNPSMEVNGRILSDAPNTLEVSECFLMVQMHFAPQFQTVLQNSIMDAQTK